MAVKLTKEQYDALPDALKSLFKSAGDDFEMSAPDDSGVEGLKANRDQILKEKKELQDKLAELEKFKADHDAERSKAEEEMLAKKGEFDKLLETKEAAWNERIKTAEAKNEQLLSNLKREQIKTLATSKGILPDRLKAAMAEGDFDSIFDLESSDNGFSIKKKGGIGDAAEIDAIFDGLKTRAPYLFTATTSAGSGASGSGTNNGSSKTITRAEYDANPGQYALALGKGDLYVAE